MRDLLSEAGLLAWLGQVTVAGGQCPEDGGLFLEGQGLGANRRFYSSFLQGRAQGLFTVLQFQIVPQRLAFLTKRKLKELDEFLFRDAEAIKPGRHREPHHRGMHSGWRRKCARRKREELLDFRIKLCRSGQKSVVAAARRG